MHSSNSLSLQNYLPVTITRPYPPVTKNGSAYLGAAVTAGYKIKFINTLTRRCLKSIVPHPRERNLNGDDYSAGVGLTQWVPPPWRRPGNSSRLSALATEFSPNA